MRIKTDRHFRTLIWGVFSLALGAACLVGVGRLGARAEPHASSVASQLRAEPEAEASTSASLLMSCADDALQHQPRPGAEPMWCANPDSPHCLPALPKPPAPDAAHGPVATLFSVLISPAARALVLPTAWPAPTAEHTRSLQLSQRLERPPRSV